MVRGAVGSCFSWAFVDAAASNLLCPCLFPRVLMYVPACAANMLKAMSASVLCMCRSVLDSISLLVLCFPLEDDVVFLLLDGVFALSGTPFP